MIGTIVPQAQALVASTAAAKNLIAGLSGMANGVKSLLGKSPLEFMVKDIGGFEFNYIGEQRLDAEEDITEHYTEDGRFLQDHVSRRPTRLVCRGYVADLNQTKSASYGLFGLGALQSVLAPVSPYVSQYSPGASKTMGKAVVDINRIDQKLNQVANLAGSFLKLVKPNLFPTACQEAYTTLESLRLSMTPFTVISPFVKNAMGTAFENMLIEHLSMVSPDNTRGFTDITVTLKEIRVCPTKPTTSNSRVAGGDAPQNAGPTNGSAVPQGALK